MKTLPIVVATVLTSSLVGVTFASTSPPCRQRVVNFADLDLNNAADARRLRYRIHDAARQVCWTRGLLEVLWSVRMHQCVRETTATALAIATRREGEIK